MDVQVFIGFDQGRVQISMLNAVTTATVEMAGPAVFTSGQANALGYFVPLRRMVCFFVSFKYFGFLGRMAGPGWEFFVCAGGFVADKAVHPGLIGKIKVFVFPTVSCMA